MNQTQDHAWAYDPETGVCLGLVSLQPDPLNEGAYFSKPNTVLFEPPAAPEGLKACLKESNGLWVWEVVPDPAAPVAPTDEEVRAGALVAVDVWYFDARNAGFGWNGHTFQSDQAAREALLTCHAAGQGTALGFWRDASNNNVPDGSPEMVHNLVKAMLAKGEFLFITRAKLREYVRTCDIAALTNFDPATQAELV